MVQVSTSAKELLRQTVIDMDEDHANEPILWEYYLTYNKSRMYELLEEGCYFPYTDAVRLDAFGIMIVGNSNMGKITICNALASNTQEDGVVFGQDSVALYKETAHSKPHIFKEYAGQEDHEYFPQAFSLLHETENTSVTHIIHLNESDAVSIENGDLRDACARIVPTIGAREPAANDVAAVEAYFTGVNCIQLNKPRGNRNKPELLQHIPIEDIVDLIVKKIKE